MQKSTLMLLFFCFTYFSSISANIPASSAPTETLAVDSTLARQCLTQAKKGKKSADFFLEVQLQLDRIDRQDIERLDALVRMEVGTKAVSDAIAVPPKGDLSIAWLLNRLSEQTETLSFDLATDGFFVRRIGSGNRYRFRPFGGKEIIVRTDAATLYHEYQEQNMQSASRLYLRKMPDGKEYYVVEWKWLSKHSNSPPPPNPEGQYVPDLMDQLPYNEE